MADNLKPEDSLQQRKSALEHRKSALEHRKSTKSVKSDKSGKSSKSDHSNKDLGSDEDLLKKNDPEATKKSIDDKTKLETADASCTDCAKEEKLVVQRGRLIIILSVVMVVLLGANGTLLALFLGCGQESPCVVRPSKNVSAYLVKLVKTSTSSNTTQSNVTGPQTDTTETELEKIDSERSLAPGQIVRYNCTPGYFYRQSGDENQTCGEDKVLTGSPLQCVNERLCQAVAKDPVAIRIGLNKTDVKKTIDISESVEYTCIKGYKNVSGDIIHTCTAADKLSGLPLKCEKRVVGDDCEALDDCLYVAEERNCSDCCYQKNKTCIKACPGKGGAGGWKHAGTNKCFHAWSEVFPERAKAEGTRLSYTDAKIYCKNKNSSLPMPKSDEENAEVVKAAKEFELKFTYTGIRLHGTKYVYDTKSKTETVYTNWGAGEPTKLAGENDINIVVDDGTWADHFPHYKKNFLCVKLRY